MKTKNVFLAITALISLLAFTAHADTPYIINSIGDLSPASFAWQWEVSSAALPGNLADGMCTSDRNEGDPQFFLSWVSDSQRIMSCSLSTIGTSDCDAQTSTAMDLSALGYCQSQNYTGPIYVPTSADNVMVRLKDGRVMQTVQTIKLNCPGSSTPACDYGTNQEDREQVSYVSRVSDTCGDGWATSVMDASAVRDLSGNLPGAAEWKNFDRVEVYADPWSDHVLLTAQTGTDPCRNADQTAFLHAFMPTDTDTPVWQQLFQHAPNAAPTVITSLPHSAGTSRVYWFNCEGFKPTLFYADNPWVIGSNIPQTIDIDALLQSSEGPGNYLCSWTNEAGAPPLRTPIRNIIGNPGIARIGTDGFSDVVRLAYTQTVSIGGLLYNVIRIVDVDVPAAGQPSAATNRKIPDYDSNPGLTPRASVFYPSIIQVDTVTDDDPAGATHLLHWTEILDDRTVVEKVASWDPVDGWKPDQELDTWTCFGPNPAINYNGDCSTGDYQYGAFVDTLDRCTHSFFVPWGVQEDVNGDAVWSEGDTIKTHGAVVTATTDKLPPVFDSVPADMTVSCEAVPDPAVLSATDTCDDSPDIQFTSVREDGNCPYNYVLTRTWTASDNTGHTSSVDQTIIVEDTTPPDIQAEDDDLYCVWPPNHKYVCFDRDDFDPLVTDNCSVSQDWFFADCQSDQADNGRGDGNTINDCVVSHDAQKICVRAERSGRDREGRRYAVSISATDECGNTSVPVVIGNIHVPHDRGKGNCKNVRNPNAKNNKSKAKHNNSNKDKGKTKDNNADPAPGPDNDSSNDNGNSKGNGNGNSNGNGHQKDKEDNPNKKEKDGSPGNSKNKK